MFDALVAKVSAWLKQEEEYVRAYLADLWARAKASWAMRGALAALAVGAFDQMYDWIPESVRDTKSFVVLGIGVAVVKVYLMHRAAKVGAADVVAPAAPVAAEVPAAPAPVAVPNAEAAPAA